MMSDQLAQMEKMGGMAGLMGMLPGVQKMKKQIAESGMDDKMIKRQRAIIGSMTKAERRKPDILAASRKRRIAAGAGVEVSEVNRLLKQHRQMADAMKMMTRNGGAGLARMASMLGGGGNDRLKNLGGGKQAAPDAKELEQLQQRLQGLGGGAPAPGGLPGLGGPSLPPGFNPFKK